MTTLAVAVTAVLSVAGWGQREAARSRSQAAQAIAEVARDPWAALERAIEAAETADTPEATDALRRGLGAPRERLILREPAGGTIHSAQFSDDGRAVLTTAYDGTVRTWQLDTGTSEITAHVRSGPPDRFGKSIDASPDGTLEVLALGGGVVRGGEEEALRRAAPGGGVVRIVDARSKAPHTERPALLERTNLGDGVEGLAPSVDFSPDGRHFLAVGYDGTARVWALNFVVLGEPGVLGVAISPDGSRCATLNDQWSAAVWSCNEGTLVYRWRLDVPGSRDRRLQPGDVALSFSGDGAALFVSVGSGSIPGTTSAWAPATGEKLTQVSAQGRSRASFDRDGTLVLLDGSAGAAEIADVGTRQRKAQLTGVPKGVGIGVFSGDGARLVTSKRGHSDVVYGLCFDPTGAFIATARGDGIARVWRTQTRREVLVRRGDSGALLQVAMSGDRLITVGLDRTAFSFACESCQTGAALLRAARAAAAARPR